MERFPYLTTRGGGKWYLRALQSNRGRVTMIAILGGIQLMGPLRGLTGHV